MEHTPEIQMIRRILPRFSDEELRAVMASLVAEIFRRSTKDAPRKPSVQTMRKTLVFQLFAEGKNPKEIAEEMNLSRFQVYRLAKQYGVEKVDWLNVRRNRELYT